MKQFVQKVSFLFLAVAVLLSPATMFAAEFSGTIEEGWYGDTNPTVPEYFSCWVAGENRMINATTNEVTYRVMYGTPESRSDVLVRLHIEDDNGIIMDKGFMSNLRLGTHAAVIAGTEEATVQFDTIQNSELAIAAQIEDINCESKVFTAVKPRFTNTIQIPQNTYISPDKFQIDTDTDIHLPEEQEQDQQPQNPDLSPDRFDINEDARIDTDISHQAGDDEQQDPPRDAIVPGECRVVAVGSRSPRGSVAITASVMYEDFLPEEYPYEIVGSSVNHPEDAVRYDGDIEIASQDEAVLRDGGQHEFHFTFIPEDAEDSYTINAHIGNAVCASVVFPAVVAEGSDNDGVVAGGRDEENQQEERVIPVGADEDDVVALFGEVAQANDSDETTADAAADIPLEPEDDSTSPFIYIVLGLIAVGLAGGLGYALKQRSI